MEHTDNYNDGMDIDEPRAPIESVGVTRLTALSQHASFRTMQHGDYVGNAWLSGSVPNAFDLSESEPDYSSPASLANWFEELPFLCSDYHIKVDGRRKNTTVSLGVPATAPKLQRALRDLRARAEQYVLDNAATIWPNKPWAEDPVKVMTKMNGSDGDTPLFRPGIDDKGDTIFVSLQSKLFAHENDTVKTEFTQIITPQDVSEDGSLATDGAGNVMMVSLEPHHMAKGAKIVPSITFNGIEKINSTMTVRLNLKASRLISFDRKLRMAVQEHTSGKVAGGSLVGGTVVAGAPVPSRFA